jgi:hypothetical protein
MSFLFWTLRDWMDDPFALNKYVCKIGKIGGYPRRIDTKCTVGSPSLETKQNMPWRFEIPSSSKALRALTTSVSESPRELFLYIAHIGVSHISHIRR